MATGTKYGLGTFETALALWIGWLFVFIMPFRITARWLGIASPVCDAPVDADRLKRARHVMRRLQRIAPRLPWRTTCLVRAVAGKLLLQRRGIAATIRLGVKIASDVEAHAWLMVGDQTILGGGVMAEYRPLADMGSRVP